MSAVTNSKPNETSIKRYSQYCQRCKGKGYTVFEKLNFFGFFQITEQEECHVCHGEGVTYHYE